MRLVMQLIARDSDDCRKKTFGSILGEVWKLSRSTKASLTCHCAAMVISF